MRSSARLETIVVIEVSYEMGDGLQARLVEEVTIGIMVWYHGVQFDESYKVLAWFPVLRGISTGI